MYIASRANSNSDDDKLVPPVGQENVIVSSLKLQTSRTVACTPSLIAAHAHQIAFNISIIISCGSSSISSDYEWHATACIHFLFPTAISCLSFANTPAISNYFVKKVMKPH